MSSLDQFLEGYEQALSDSGNPLESDVRGMLKLAEMEAEVPIPSSLMPVYAFIRERLRSGDFPREWLGSRLLQAKRGVEIKGKVHGLLKLVGDLVPKTTLDLARDRWSAAKEREVKTILAFTVIRKLKDDHSLNLEDEDTVESIEAALFQTTEGFYIFCATVSFGDREPISISPILVSINFGL